MAGITLDVKDILENVDIVLRAAVIAYNRLSPRPRAENLNESLRAAVRDPLWMLTRQWQLGEFEGEDTGSPVSAKIGYAHQSIDRIKMGQQPAMKYDHLQQPLEVAVEKEGIHLDIRRPGAGFHGDLMFSVKLGKLFAKAVNIIPGAIDKYITRFPIITDEEDEEALQIGRSLNSLLPDGCAIVAALADGTHASWLPTAGFSGPDQLTLTAIVQDLSHQFRQRLNRIFSQPESSITSPAWVHTQLEYAFDIATPPAAQQAQTVLTADQYTGGTLDWYAFDLADQQHPGLHIDGDIPLPPPPLAVESFIPAPMRFRGMPQPRFWQMEENQLDFGKIDASTTSTLSLLLAEFGLVYGNDWFVLPHPLTINTLCEINGLLITDTFGFHTRIIAAGSSPETNWQRWAMYHLSERNSTARTTRSLFLLPPAVNKSLVSEPIDQVNFIRDEMANMVWGVETFVPSQTGKGMSGKYKADAVEPPPFIPANEEVKIKYTLGTTVPKNWIPFVPARVALTIDQIKLQRARLAGSTPARTAVIADPPTPSFINEEEVPRAGVIVERHFQRARWIAGSTFVWSGRQKQAGRGEGASKLAFDQVEQISEKEG
jgi:hypothetical protein